MLKKLQNKPKFRMYRYIIKTISFYIILSGFIGHFQYKTTIFDVLIKKEKEYKIITFQISEIFPIQPFHKDRIRAFLVKWFVVPKIVV